MAFYSGLSVIFAEVTDGKTTIPANLTGQIYSVMTTNGTAVDDSNIVAGPHIFQFNFNSHGKYIRSAL
jgi:hypothetical protein